MPNKDFVVEYRLAGDQATLATLAHRGQSGGYFTLVVQPKWKTETAELAPREVILLLDTSGSMEGTGISQLRVFAGHVLAGLNPQDTFRIIAFSDRPRAFHEQALPATPENVAAGQQFVRSLQAGGGTEMLPALRRALGTGSGERRQVRYLVLVTDALVGNDNSILGYLKRPEFGDVRVFPVAMGAAPNHYLISRAAEVARGFALQVTNQDNAAEMARRFNEKVAAPYMTDLEIDWGTLAVKDVIPGPLPDLYAGRPLVVMGRYDKPGKGQVTLRGNIQGQAVATSLELDLPEKEPAHDCLGSLWARQRIRQIWNRDLGSETPQGQAEITQLGVDAPVGHPLHVLRGRGGCSPRASDRQPPHARRARDAGRRDDRSGAGQTAAVAPAPQPAADQLRRCPAGRPVHASKHGPGARRRRAAASRRRLRRRLRRVALPVEPRHPGRRKADRGRSPAARRSGRSDCAMETSDVLKASEVSGPAELERCVGEENRPMNRPPWIPRPRAPGGSAAAGRSASRRP